jgi:hypothetical protein
MTRIIGAFARGLLRPFQMPPHQRDCAALVGLRREFEQLEWWMSPHSRRD